MDVDLKIKQEKELFDDWKKKNNKIIPDGVVSFEDYAKSNCKILFVLKEVNSDETDWDLREFLRNGGRDRTWNNICRWVKGIRNIDKDYNWKDIVNIEEAERKEYLKSIAVLNLKKYTGGKAVANNDEIFEYAVSDSELLKRQVDIYEPDLIILCGTEYPFFNSVYKNIDIKWEMTHKGVRYVIDNNRIIISYNHPEARVSPNFLYYLLMDALREINDKSKIWY